MAVIEFKNLETLEYWKSTIEEAEKADMEFSQKCKRGAYLLRHAHYWSGV